MAHILVTEEIVPKAINKLKDHFEVTVAESGIYEDEERLLSDVHKYDAILSMLSIPVTGRVLRAGKKLKIVANYAVGFDNIDISAAKKYNIRVANTPDVLTEASADGTLALLLAVARKVTEADACLRKGEFDGWHPNQFLGMELNNKTLGIVGMGSIGSAVARRARGFGMNIYYHNRTRVEKRLENKLQAKYIADVKELVSQSDVVSLNCPLTEETHHLIDKSLLEAMPDHALLINTARGAVVDESALADALHNGQIAGAGIDVFENEPDIHPRLLSAPNTVLTPHIASATTEARTRMGLLAANAIIKVLKGFPKSEITNLVC